MRQIKSFCLFTLMVVLIPYAMAMAAETRTIHVLVALCDNASQGIVPVPAKIGNGDDPANNLYWGCAYGVATYMKKQPEWRLLQCFKNPADNVMERLVFKHTSAEAYLVADAYAGRYIKQTTVDLLNFAAGLSDFVIELDNDLIPAGGGADLLVYVGHNGLMDFSLPRTPAPADAKQRDVAVFACASRDYFQEPILNAGAHPLVLTTNLMCPEAYSLAALAQGWVKGDSADTLHEKIAAAYHKYQKCGLKGARGLFVCAAR